MKQNPSAVVLSVWGRGHWLAAELRRIGFDVALVDLTSQMGRYQPEDIEGPFGYFHTEALLETQVARLDQADYSEEVEDGLTLWLKSGPIDFRGPISQFLTQRLEQSPEVFEFLQKFEAWTDKERDQAINRMMKLEFQQRWLAHFAQNISAPVFRESTAPLKNLRPLPLFNKLNVRRVSRRGHEKSLEWVRSKGVQVFDQVVLTDIMLEPETRLCIRSNTGELEIAADQLVFSITSAELDYLSIRAREKVFTKVLRPQWCWLRYRFEFLDSNTYSLLPNHFIMIEDLALPWTHTNTLFVQKTQGIGQFDVWALLPYEYVREKNYEDKIVQEISVQMSTRLPGVSIRLVDGPHSEGSHTERSVQESSDLESSDLESSDLESPTSAGSRSGGLYKAATQSLTDIDQKSNPKKSGDTNIDGQPHQSKNKKLSLNPVLLANKQNSNHYEKNMSHMVFGVYDQNELSQLRSRKNMTWHFDSPEFWQTFEWSGRFVFQREVFLNILNWKDHYDESYKRFIEKQLAQEAAQKKREIK